MTDALSVGLRCQSPLQILGITIVALLFLGITIVAYRCIRFTCICILKFCKVDVDIDKDNLHLQARFRQ